MRSQKKYIKNMLPEDIEVLTAMPNELNNDDSPTTSMKEIVKSTLIIFAIFFVIAFILKLTGFGQKIDNSTIDDSMGKQELTLIERVSLEKIEIDGLQVSTLLSTGKYLHIPEYEKDGTTYAVTEYVMPDKSVGYQTTINNGKTVESTCTGNDCSWRVWKQIIDTSSTTTK